MLGLVLVLSFAALVAVWLGVFFLLVCRAKAWKWPVRDALPLLLWPAWVTMAALGLVGIP